MKFNIVKILPLLLTGLLLSACNNDDDNDDVRVNVPPTIEAIQNQMIQANRPSDPIIVNLDDDVPNLGLALSGSTDNPGLIAGFIFGSGANRAIQIRPTEGQLGTSNITITVTDSDGATAQTTFQVIVIEEMASVSNLVPLIFADNANANPRDLNTRILVQDADDIDFFQSLNL